MAIAKIVYKESANATPVTWMDATSATAAAADITAPKTAMLADGVMTTGTGSGGGTGGLEYETGTYTPAEDIARPTIAFFKTHTVPPAFVTMSDASENATLAQNDTVYFSLVDSYRFAGSGWPYSASSLRNGFVAYSYLGSSVTATNGTIPLSYNSDNTGDSTTSYYRYWATESNFIPSANNTSRFWRAGRTYKWIAVWAPST